MNKAVEAADNVYLDFRHSSVEYRRDLLDKIVKNMKIERRYRTSNH